MSRTIELTKGALALVSDEDFDMLSCFSWHLTAYGYAASRINGKIIYMHRLVLGVTDPNVLVDHRDGNHTCNTRENLRVASRRNNGRNRHKLPITNTSGFVGVSYQPARWRATINLESGQKHLGYFSTPQEAAKAYDDAAKKYFGDFASLNSERVGALTNASTGKKL
jgi:hypothetical protein